VSAVTKARYRDAHLSAFRRVLAAWLAKLPPDGWEGDVTALEGALVKIARRAPVPAFVPRETGLGRRIAAERSFIQTSGFRVEFRRTKRHRTLRFTRTPFAGDR
jgi:hypothetical protein